MIVGYRDKQCFTELFERSDMYKFGIICCLLAVGFVGRNHAAITEAQKSKIYGKLLASGVECMKDFPLNLDHIKSFRSRKIPDDDVAKCFANCLFKRLGIMDDTGKVSEKSAHASVKKVFKEGNDMLTKVDDLLGKCIHVNEEQTSDGDKGCERAKLAFECFTKHAPELGLDVDF